MQFICIRTSSVHSFQTLDLSLKKNNKTKSNQSPSHPGHLLISNSKSDSKTDGGEIAFPRVSWKQDIGLFDKLR